MIGSQFNSDTGVCNKFVNLILFGFIVLSISCGGNDSSVEELLANNGSGPLPSQDVGQLVIELDEAVDPTSVEAYAVGQQDKGTTSVVSPTKVVIDGVDPGEHDIIVTGTLSVQEDEESEPEADDSEDGESSSDDLIKADARLMLQSDNVVGTRLNNVKFGAGERTSLNQVELGKLGLLTGEVTLSGQADHSGIEVYIPGTGYTARTSQSGKFALFGIPPGIHNLQIEKDGYHRARLEGITVESDQEASIASVSLLLSTGAEGLIRITGGSTVYESRTVPVDIAASSDAVLFRVSTSPTFLNTPWQPMTASFQYTFTTAGDDKQLFVQFSDANGLESAVFESNKVKIAIFPENSEGSGIGLALELMDPRVYKVRASFQKPKKNPDIIVADCQTILSGGELSWSKYESSYEITLLAGGLQSVCVQFRDEDGVLSPLYSQSVNFDVIPNTPNQLEASSYSETSLRLTWSDNSSNETSFVIERSLDNVSFVPISTVSSSSTSFTDGSLVTGQLYYYRIKALNGAWVSDYSEVASAAPVASVPLSPSDLNAVVASSTSVMLSWNDKSSNETNFVLLVSESGGSYEFVSNIEAGVEIYIDTGLSPGSSYIYRLCANNSAGCSDYAFSNKVTPIAGIPAAPSGLVASLSSPNAITLSWVDGSDNEDAFIVERSLDGNSFSFHAALAPNTSTFVDTNLVSGQTYSYQVRARNTAGNSNYLNRVSITPGLPLPPTNLSLSNTDITSVTLQWLDKSNNETSFVVEREQNSDGFLVIAVLGADAEAFVDDTVVLNNLYKYRVKAVHAVGESPYSNVSQFTAGAPTIPIYFEANPISENAISLTWTDTSNIETGFMIERLVNGGSYVALTSLAANTQSYVDNSVSGANSYRYRIRAVKDAEVSPWLESRTVASDAMTLSWAGAPAIDGDCNLYQQASVVFGSGYSGNGAEVSSSIGNPLSANEEGFSLKLTSNQLSDGQVFQAKWTLNADPGDVSQFQSANYTVNLNTRPRLVPPLLPQGPLTQLNTLKEGAQPGNCSLSRRAELALGFEFSCMLENTGKVACTGSRDDGRLGDGLFAEARAPLAYFPEFFDGSSDRQIEQLTFGENFSCALTSEAEIFCVGTNYYGQLGDGTEIDRENPVAVDLSFLDSDPVLIQSGDYNSCLVTEGGRIYCWGRDFRGSNGIDNTTAPALLPTEVNNTLVDGTPGKTAVDLKGIGYRYTAILDDGSLICWGQSLNGECGAGLDTSHETPVAVDGTLMNGTPGEKAVSIHLTLNYTCALTDGGKVYCWGRNQYGYLGDGTTSNSNVPVAATSSILDGTNGKKAVALSAGAEHVCAILDNGKVSCWGRGAGGGLGAGDALDRSVPTLVDDTVLDGSAGHKAVSIATMLRASCAALDSGKVMCWGVGSYLGNGSVTEKTSPFFVDETEISGELGKSAVKVSSPFAQGTFCAQLDDGRLKCWGRNVNFLLGDPGFLDSISLYPRSVASNIFDGSSNGKVSQVKHLETLNMVVISEDKRAFWWGERAQKFTAVKANGERLQYVVDDVLSGEGGVTGIDAYQGSVCATLQSGRLACWGNNLNAKLGLGDEAARASAELVAPDLFDGSSGMKVASASVGGTHSCALTESGAVYCWGSNDQGQLGRGNVGGVSPLPVLNSFIDGTSGRKAVGIASGASNTCAVMEDGRIRCWGRGESLGDGANVNSGEAVLVDNTYFDGTIGKKAVGIAGGNLTFCAITDIGKVRCWGDNGSGQLGDGNRPNDSAVPVAVDESIIDGTNIKANAIAVGTDSVCAVLSNGTLACWGNNGDGQIGDGTNVHRQIPTLVDQTSINGQVGARAIAVEVGAKHACAVLDSQRMYCWGEHRDSQLGTDYTGQHLIPTIVLDIGNDPSFLNSAAAQSEHFSISGP